MDFENTVHPFDLGNGEQYFLVYVDKDSSAVCSISLEVVTTDALGNRSGKRLDVAIDYRNKPQKVPTCYILPFNDENMQAFENFKMKLA